MWGKCISLMQKQQMFCSGLKRRTLREARVVFHYAEKGKASKDADNPTLLILHGFAESMETWASVVSNLPRGIHVITLDLPGHGSAPLQFASESDKPSTDSFVRFVQKFIQSKELDRLPSGLHLLGHSFGGYLAAQTATLNGAALRVRWLTLVSPAMVTPVASPFWQAVLAGKFEEWLIPTTIEGMRAMVMNVTGMTEEDSKRRKNRCLIKGLHELRLPRIDVSRLIWEGLRPDLDRYSEIEKQWEIIGAKTHVLWGTEDRLIDASGASRLSSVISDTFVEMMEGQPHGLNLVAPSDVAKSILRFREKARQEEEEGEGWERSPVANDEAGA